MQIRDFPALGMILSDDSYLGHNSVKFRKWIFHLTFILDQNAALLPAV